MSQASPSSVGVESVSSGSWPWNRMWRSRCRNWSAASETPGKRVSVASAGSGQSFDQSERTNTTLPARDAPVPALEAADVAHLEVVVEVALHLAHDRDHHERPHGEVGGSSSIAAYSGAQCAGGSSCVPSWSVESAVRGGLEAVVRVGVRLRPWPD